MIVLDMLIENMTSAFDLVGDGMSSAFSSVIRGWLPASLPKHRHGGKRVGKVFITLEISIV